MNIADLTPEQLEGAIALAVKLLTDSNSSESLKALLNKLQVENPTKILEVAHVLTQYNKAELYNQLYAESKLEGYDINSLKAGDVVRSRYTVSLIMAEDKEKNGLKSFSVCCRHDECKALYRNVLEPGVKFERVGEQEKSSILKEFSAQLNTQAEDLQAEFKKELHKVTEMLDAVNTALAAEKSTEP